MNGEDLPGLDEIQDSFLYDWIQGDRPNVPEDHYFSISLRELDDLVKDVRKDEHMASRNSAQEWAEKYVESRLGTGTYRDGTRDMAVKVVDALKLATSNMSRQDIKRVDDALARLFDKEL